jgi:transcriptional regulator with XRE-family HTH domain
MKKRRQAKLVRFPLWDMMQTAGISISALAKLTGITRANIRAVMKGTQDPRWSTLARLLQGVGVRAMVFDEDYLTADGAEVTAEVLDLTAGLNGHKPDAEEHLPIYDLAGKSKRGRRRKDGGK